MFWFTLILWAVSFAASELMAAQAAKKNKAKPAKLGNFTLPTASEDRRIPWIWGTIKQSGPNVIWYGNLRRKGRKVKSGMFSKTTVGYYYYLGIQFALAKGPCILKKIWYGENLIWTGSAGTGGDLYIQKAPEQAANPNWPTWSKIKIGLFSSVNFVIHSYDKVPSGTLQYYPGTSVQGPDGYLAYFQSPCPAYRNLAYAIFDGYVGENTSIAPWSFELTRIPNGLALGDPTVNTLDANPMNVAYEILTDVYGFAAGDIDIAGWQAAAEVLRTEGNGFSWIVDSPRKASDVIKELEVQMDGHFYLDPASGQWRIELIRGGYDVNLLPVLDNTNVITCTLFSRGTWTGSTNEVRVEFNNRNNYYTDSSSVAQDLANMAIQAKRVPLTVDLPGVRIPELAGKIAWRELRSLSFPLAMARVECDRSLWYGHVGMAVVYNYNVDAPIVMRITKINVAKAAENAIEIDLTQDAFSTTAAGFETPSSGWVPPTTDMSEFGTTAIQEAPFALTRRADDITPVRLWAMAADQFDGATGFIMRIDGFDMGVVDDCTRNGELLADITATDTTIDVACYNVAADQFLVATATSVGQNLVNLVMIGDELVAPTSVTDIDGGVRLSGCYRGLCDTAQAPHLATEVAWFTNLGSGLSDSGSVAGSTVDVKIIPYNTEREVADAEVAVDPLTFDYREDRPYPPTLLSLNASLFPASVDIDSGVALTFNRRDRRIYDEVSQLAVDAETLDPTFPAAESTQYKAIVYSGGVEIWSGAYNGGTATVSAPLVKILRYYVGCPTDLEVGVRTRHNATYESQQDLKHTASVTSVLLDDFWFGILDTYQTSLPWTAPATGNYDFTLDVALDADLQAKVNGGALTTIIAAGNTIGTLNGVVVGDIIEIRHLDSTSADEALLMIDAPGVATDAYAVLIFTNVYWTVGGFGRGGFGLGPFGR
jgi:hypothetical protein